MISELENAMDSASSTQGCADLLREGLELLTRLPDEDYAFPSEEGIWSSPGSHTRHIVDYFDCLFSGIDARSVDYTDRKRRAELEE